jgi:ABC-type uncharacterized transport system ATPase subunit
MIPRSTLIKDGNCKILVYGPFDNPRDHIEKVSKVVKQTYTTHKCEWDRYNIKFWVI